MKIVLLICAALYLHGASFTEDRYIYSLDTHMQAKGEMEFKDQEIIMEYSKPRKKRLHFYSDRVRIKMQQLSDTTTVQTKRYENHPQFLYIYLLTQAVYHDNYSKLRPDFTIEEKNGVRILYPRERVQELFEKIRVQKTTRHLQIEIFMESKDRIRIESTL
ncbi:MAG: hypothetical protein ACQERK_03165 [Campylobacterota bacterium]